MPEPNEKKKVVVPTREPKKKSQGTFDNLRSLPHPVEEFFSLPEEKISTPEKVDIHEEDVDINISTHERPVDINISTLEKVDIHSSGQGDINKSDRHSKNRIGTLIKL